MSKDEDCVIKMKTVMDSGSNGQDAWCLERSLLQSGVLCLLLRSVFKRRKPHGARKSVLSGNSVRVCLGYMSVRQSCSSNKSQIHVSFAHVSGPSHLDP